MPRQWQRNPPCADTNFQHTAAIRQLARSHNRGCGFLFHTGWKGAGGIIIIGGAVKGD